MYLFEISNFRGILYGMCLKNGSRRDAMKISNEVANVLANSRSAGNKLFLPEGQLERKLYLAVDKVLKALGGKWSRNARAHLFNDDVAAIVEEVVLTGEYTDQKKEYQFFETPPEVAAELIRLANIQAGETVLEPSAGRGRIASLVDCCDCVELNHENREYLSGNGFNLVGDDFLMFTGEYDVIVANPPFTRQQDIEHINHMMKIAKRRVVSVASAAVLFRDNNKTVKFRDKIKEMGGTIIPLPAKAFAESGTNVSTCVVCVDVGMENA